MTCLSVVCSVEGTNGIVLVCCQICKIGVTHGAPVSLLSFDYLWVCLNIWKLQWFSLDRHYVDRLVHSSHDVLKTSHSSDEPSADAGSPFIACCREKCGELSYDTAT